MRRRANWIATADTGRYIGVPLVDSQDNTISSMCVIEHEPRQRAHDVELLLDIAAAVMGRVENRA
jgi:hypothetical protein